MHCISSGQLHKGRNPPVLGSLLDRGPQRQARLPGPKRADGQARPRDGRHLERWLLDPRQLQEILGHLLKRREEWIERHQGHVAELQASNGGRTKLKRLYQAIEDGIADLSDSSLKDRLAESVRRGDRHAAARAASCPFCRSAS